MASSEILIAALAGVFWGFGPLGKRFGVATAEDAEKATFAACTFMAYGIGGIIMPMIDFMTVDPSNRHLTFADKEWCSRLPVVIGCGTLSGVGGVTVCYALALANREVSSVISMVANGTLSVLAALMIMILFHENFSILKWISGIMIVIGVLLADAGKSRAQETEKNEEQAHVTFDMEGQAQRGQKVGAPSVFDTDADEDTQGMDEDRTGYGATGSQERQCGSWSEKFSFGAVAWAFLAGILWAFGPLGKSYGVAGAPDGLQKTRSACTLFLYNLGVLLPGIILICHSYLMGNLQASVDMTWWTRRAPVVAFCGLLSGFGGVLGTYAYAYAAENNSAIVSIVENGIYTVVGGLLIATVYAEVPSRAQWLSAAIITAAVVLVQAV